MRECYGSVVHIIGIPVLSAGLHVWGSIARVQQGRIGSIEFAIRNGVYVEDVGKRRSVVVHIDVDRHALLLHVVHLLCLISIPSSIVTKITVEALYLNFVDTVWSVLHGLVDIETWIAEGLEAMVEVITAHDGVSITTIVRHIYRPALGHTGVQFKVGVGEQQCHVGTGLGLLFGHIEHDGLYLGYRHIDVGIGYGAVIVCSLHPIECRLATFGGTIFYGGGNKDFTFVNGCL